MHMRISSAGITVLPVRSTRVAPAAKHFAFRPTWRNWLPATMKAESAMIRHRP